MAAPEPGQCHFPVKKEGRRKPVWCGKQTLVDPATEGFMMCCAKHQAELEDMLKRIRAGARSHPKGKFKIDDVEMFGQRR